MMMGRKEGRKGNNEEGRERGAAVKSPGKKARVSLPVCVARLIVGFDLRKHGSKKGWDDTEEEDE